MPNSKSSAAPRRSSTDDHTGRAAPPDEGSLDDFPGRIGANPGREREHDFEEGAGGVEHEAEEAAKEAVVVEGAEGEVEVDADKGADPEVGGPVEEMLVDAPVRPSSPAATCTMGVQR